MRTKAKYHVRNTLSPLTNKIIGSMKFQMDRTTSQPPHRWTPNPNRLEMIATLTHKCDEGNVAFYQKACTL